MLNFEPRKVGLEELQRLRERIAKESMNRALAALIMAGYRRLSPVLVLLHHSAADAHATRYVPVGVSGHRDHAAGDLSARAPLRPSRQPGRPTLPVW